MNNDSTKDNVMFGGILCITGYIVFAIMSAVSKYLQKKSGFPTIEITFFSYFFVFLLSLPWILRTGIVKVFKTEYLPLIITRTILGVLTFYLYFLVVYKIPLVNAVTLINTAPLWVVLLAAVILKERVSKATIMCIVLGFIGVVLVIHPTLQGLSLAPYIVALIVGILAASVITCRRMLKSESWQRIVAIYSMVASLISGLIMIPVFRMPHGVEWVLVAAIGITMYFMQAVVQLAAHYAKASTLGPLSYIGIVVSGIIGWLVWGHIPSPVSLIGIGTIIVSGIMILLVGLREQKNA